ncbi:MULTISPECIES: aromatic amino acid transaminase [Pseudomonas syringae group]|uniref:Aminotransferase n=1 Tax=Pseudomonas coronafaciens pv. porri TaxID=83964 RepID=A0ABR5JUN6_9PSED|nr:amino acid aminotransferase [Pseudomonas coronafaciens]KOP58415.1 aromatic amino acid aminotransferase [Pseudomonas coronafaciens pv. porri]KOP61134.1 aromatic amino acid aminotransferase [Pseudomonas coronafaciens pv. porri]KPX31392.1 Aromatic amino acid aminotransferase [Pseudomonas coronafaciens pv. garcae]KPZ27021.1 Aromatic amino acid aminotransferase [Pseudomonas coronafaciens pv. zizaniae]RMS89547.1 Aromatic amino acid aminotransferase [Pseudomonas coronafaciens pv. oryzae]
MLAHVESYAGDPILSLMETFGKDSRADKVNLSIGLYYDAQGRIPQLACVAAAQQQLAQGEQVASVYLPMEGLAAYRQAVQTLLFGADHPLVQAGRVATIQTVGGSGALKVGADFLKYAFPNSQVWVSDPTWENHLALFGGAGFKVNTYPYFDAQTGGVRFEAMLDTVQSLPAQSILLLHPCCHNPTGADLSVAQWDQLIEVVKERQLIAFLDIAYQGFGKGMDEDAYAIRAMADAGVTTLVSNSFSKIFSLYGERVGGLSVVCEDTSSAANVFGQLKATVRRNYSSPPAHGAFLASKVLNTPLLRDQWLSEVEAMRLRIIDMRTRLVSALAQKVPGRDFSFILRQSGMFSYTGLTPQQVDELKDVHGIYMLRSGRVCMAGLNEGNVDKVCDAIASLFTH